VIAVVVVYDYHPNSQTLFEAHLRPKAPQYQNGRLQSQNARIPERTIWSYVVQIASAMKAVHDAGLAMRIIDATKILLTGQNRYIFLLSTKRATYDVSQDSR
jgi:PAB-dependent poly(A)-specific ribonuclease subunit 3